MNVAGIIKQKGSEIVTARGDATLSDTAKVLVEHRIGAIVVTDDAGSVEGILSERDIVRAVAEAGADALSDRHDQVADLMARMTEGRFRHVPVVEDDKLVGIVSIGDIVKHRIAETELEVESMRGYIASG